MPFSSHPILSPHVFFEQTAGLNQNHHVSNTAVSSTLRHSQHHCCQTVSAIAVSIAHTISATLHSSTPSLLPRQPGQRPLSSHHHSCPHLPCHCHRHLTLSLSSVSSRPPALTTSSLAALPSSTFSFTTSPNTTLYRQQHRHHHSKIQGSSCLSLVFNFGVTSKFPVVGEGQEP